MSRAALYHWRENVLDGGPRNLILGKAEQTEVMRWEKGITVRNRVIVELTVANSELPKLWAAQAHGLSLRLEHGCDI